MCALWGKTISAVNRGYGMSRYNGITLPTIGLPNPYYKPRPWGIPEFNLNDSLIGDWGTIRRRQATRGSGKFVKGSPEAKAYMAKLRAMRASKKRGGKSLMRRNVRGGNFFTDLLSDIGDSGLAMLKGLAAEGHTSIIQLLADPAKLLALAGTAGPAVVSFVKRILGIDKREKAAKEEENEALEDKKTKKQLLLLARLKKLDPAAYQAALKKFQLQQMKNAGLGDDDDDDVSSMMKEFDLDPMNIYSEDNPPPLPPRNPPKKKKSKIILD